MSAARDELLERIRTALGPERERPEVVRAYRRTLGSSPVALLELFVERLLDYRAEVERVEPEAVSVAVAAVLERHGAARVVVPQGLPGEWAPAGVECLHDAGFDARSLDGFDALVSGCTLAIAETGTIVLSAGPAEGRRALSLVPDLHVCVVGADQILDGLPAAIERLAPLAASPARPLTFISGPSATSDIELSRVEGVHGPRRLVVVIVAPPPAR